jgi:hypothetical protein
MADELRRVKFEDPDGMAITAFHPLGVNGLRNWPFGGRRDRMLVMSPFVSVDFLREIAEETSESALVSRSDTLLPLSAEDLSQFDRVFQLNSAAEPDGAPEDAQDDGTPPLAGLHAKLYVADAGWDARIWTGSANATTAGFDGNVEFLVELVGKKGRFGVDALLASESLGSLLQETPTEREPVPPDATKVALEKALDAARSAIAGAGLRAVYEPADTGALKLQIQRDDDRPIRWPMGVTGFCWPISAPAGRASPVAIASQCIATFDWIPCDDLTSFVAFELTAGTSPKNAQTSFVLNLPIEGAPSDRYERLLQVLLQNQSQVLRLLRFLLADVGEDVLAILEGNQSDNPGNGSIRSDAEAQPLFEMLVRALDRNPARLDEVARLFEDLGKDDERRKLLPERFDEIWLPIWESRKRLRP